MRNRRCKAGGKRAQIVCRYAPKTPPDMKALIMCSCARESSHGGGDPCASLSVCGWMDGVGSLSSPPPSRTAQHHHSVHSNSFVRILILLTLAPHPHHHQAEEGTHRRKGGEPEFNMNN